MNSHLSSAEICNWLAGERAQEDDWHLGECAACRAELDRLQKALTGFRGSLEQVPVPAIRYGRGRQSFPRWILATAALSLLMAAPAYWNARQERAAEKARTDDLLLERVDAGLSRAVPASMEPLMQLVWKEEKE